MEANVVLIDQWTAEQAQEILKKRLDNAKRYRERNREKVWRYIEQRVYPYFSGNSSGETVNVTSGIENMMAQASSDSVGITIPQIAKNVRFLHSQLSANPPAVTPVPSSTNPEDRKVAITANSLCTYARQHYFLQDKIDLSSLETILQGTGITFSGFNPKKGEILKKDAKSVTLAGDYEVRPVSVWALFFDPDARMTEDIKWTFEEFYFPFEEARLMFPGQDALLKQGMINKSGIINSTVSSALRALGVATQGEEETEYVKIYSYYEKGTPYTAYKGRHCWCLETGVVVTPIKDNPTPDAKIPYSILTDIDVPGHVYGESTVAYALKLADVADDLENMILDNVEIHGDLQVIVYETGAVDEASVRKSPVNMIKVKGTAQQAPTYLSPPSLSIDIYQLRNSLRTAIDDIMGINEILQGQIPNRMSGFSAETAINAANTIRHRLFNKYAKYIKELYTLYLSIVKDYWKVKRKIEVVGVDNALYVASFDGTDLEGEYAIYVEAGTTFSLDPMTRRSEILQLREIFNGAGIEDKVLLKKLRFNEFDNLFDEKELAERRQLEIFDRMRVYYDKYGKVKEIPASDMRVAYHLEMAEAAKQYFMTTEFILLDKDLKDAMYKHYDERLALAASEATGGEAAAAPPEQGMLPQGIPPGMDPGVVL